MFKKIIDLSNCRLHVRAGYSLDNVLGYGSRINNKRSFLFISKILGKHIPVPPKKLIITYKKLSLLINPIIQNENVMVIGLAETATGLGWGVFDHLTANSKIYIHTTRVRINHPMMVEFEEPHSHAVEQYLYYPQSKNFKEKDINHIIIIDDELTTGNTIKNLIVKLTSKFPAAEFSVLTLVNWKNYKKDFKVYALYEGSFSVNEKQNNPPSPFAIQKNPLPFRNTLANKYGRVGAYHFPIIPTHVIDRVSKIKQKRILLLGTGEFMYFPLMLSMYFHSSNSIKIQSTTRSPVEIGGDIHSKIAFKDNYYPTVPNYLYNVIDKKYDIIFIFYEIKSRYDNILIDQLSKKFDRVIPIYI